MKTNFRHLNTCLNCKYCVSWYLRDYGQEDGDMGTAYLCNKNNNVPNENIFKNIEKQLDYLENNKLLLIEEDTICDEWEIK